MAYSMMEHIIYYYIIILQYRHAFFSVEILGNIFLHVLQQTYLFVEYCNVEFLRSSASITPRVHT